MSLCRPRPIVHSALALAIAVGNISAQERVKIQPPTKAPTQAEQKAVEGQGGEAIGPFQDAFTPAQDKPDFAPMADVTTLNKDGEILVTGQRLLFNPYTLSFPSRNFQPKPGIDMRMLLAAAKNPTGYTYGYIMIRNAMGDPRKIRTLRDLGVKLIGPHTFQSYEAVIPLSRLNVIGALPFVHWVGYALPEQKLDPKLTALTQKGAESDRFRVDIATFTTDINPQSKWLVIGTEKVAHMQTEAPMKKLIPNGAFHQALVAAGMEFEHYTDNDTVHIFRGFANRQDIARIKDLDFVAYIEPVQKHVLFHDQSMAMINQDRVRKTYHGGTIMTGVIDSGLHTSPRHQDFNPKWLYGLSTSSASAFLDGCRHGTHVTGTVTGEGIANSDYKGAAPGLGHTKLTSFRIGRYFSVGSGSSGGCGPTGSVSSLYAFMATTYTSYGPRAHVINNSWGSSNSSGYNGAESGARTLDSYCYTHQQTHVFASGNSGTWCGSPASAKNALTVGGVLDYWSGTTTVPGDPYTSSGNFTSDTGGTRRKPEVTAPASKIESATASTTTSYRTESGTSMAAPHITGAVASMTHHYASYYNYKVPNVKATLMCSAEYQGNPGSSSGWFLGGGAGGGSGCGYGMINASSMHGSSSHSWFTGTHSGELTSSGQWVYWNVAVPSTAKHLKLVVNWIETAASSGATKARRADLRTYVDVPPYTAGGNTGEFSSSSAVSNVLSISSTDASSTGMCRLSRGKTVRVKIHAASIPSGTRCRVGFTILWHYRTATSPYPVLTTSASPTIVKPSGYVTLSSTVASLSTGDDFENARVYPYNLGGFVTTQLYRYTADNILHSYTGTSHPSYPYPSLTGGMTIGQGGYSSLSRLVRFRMRAPTSSGVKTIYMRMTADPGNRLLQTATSVCVDGVAPNKPGSLKSTTHSPSVWSANRTIRFTWTPGADNGCAGLLRQYYRFQQSSCPTPTTSMGTTTNTLTFSSIAQTTSSTGHYFGVRSYDRAGNYGSSSCVGPYLIDYTRPVVTRFYINGNAACTTSTTVSLQTIATDTTSGVYQMRHSNSGSTWSPWRSYTTGSIAWSLLSYGGSSAQGTRSVYCQVRDRALNVSIIYRDQILYDSTPPNVKCQLNSGAAYTSSLTATLTTTISSSAASMQYSNNGTTWSPWLTYTSSRSVSLSAYGGNSLQGTKKVSVRCRDACGNVGNTCSDLITYLITPRVTSLAISSLTNVTKGYYDIRGTNFTYVSRVYFGPTIITDRWTSANENWWGGGAFRIVSDTRILIYPPQARPAGNYTCTVRNPLQTSNAFSLRVLFEGARRLYVNRRLTSGSTLTINWARSSSEPASTPGIICYSPLNSPSVLPGIVTLEIGAGFGPLLFQLPIFPFNSATRCMKFDLPTTGTTTGLKLWFEGVYVRNPFPLPTSNADSMTIL